MARYCVHKGARLKGWSTSKRVWSAASREVGAASGMIRPPGEHYAAIWLDTRARVGHADIYRAYSHLERIVSRIALLNNLCFPGTVLGSPGRRCRCIPRVMSCRTGAKMRVSHLCSSL